jgi:hypothetical protein
MGDAFATVPKPALVTTQSSIQRERGNLSPGIIKKPESETDHSPPSSVEVKNKWSYTYTPQYVFMVWCIIKHRDIFTNVTGPWFITIITKVLH